MSLRPCAPPAFLALALALTQCGSPGQDPVPQDGPVDVVSLPLGLDVEPRSPLGAGWDGPAEEARELCITSSNVDLIPARASGFGPVTSSEAIRLLGFDDLSESTRTRFGLLGDGARAVAARTLIDWWFGTQEIESFEARFDVEALDTTSLVWAVDADAPDFFARCGDRVTLRRQGGGRILTAWRIEHASWDSKVAFHAQFGWSVYAWRSADRALRAALASWKGRAAMRVLAIQRGGDPAALSTALGDGAVASAWELGCPMDDLRPCAVFLERARSILAAQGPGTALASLEAFPVDLGLARYDWAMLGPGPAKRWAPAAVTDARSHLLAQFDAQIALRSRLDVLEGGSLEVAEAVVAQLPGWRAVVTGNLEVLGEAAGDCWDRLRDPSDPAQVARCEASAVPATLAARGFDGSVTLAGLSAEAPVSE